MKSLLTTLTTIMAFGMLTVSLPVLAQTPDGQTPAEETVCDPLQADGITKGLYGLCVAFCEAGDWADELNTITPEELATLEASTPSGRILANYNKKKDKANNPADPDMPCILVEEPCPCWTADELSTVADGLLDNGAPAGLTNCVDQVGTSLDYILAVDFDNITGAYLEDATLYDYNAFHACYFYIRNPAVPTVSRLLSIESGTLTQDQYDSCKSQMRTHWDALTACTSGNHP